MSSDEKRIIDFWEFEALPLEKRKELTPSREESEIEDPELTGDDAEIEVPEPVEGELGTGDGESDEASDDTIDFDNLSTGVEDLDAGGDSSSDDGTTIDFDVDLGTEGAGESEEGTATGDELDLNLGTGEDGDSADESDEEDEESKDKESKTEE